MNETGLIMYLIVPWPGNSIDVEFSNNLDNFQSFPGKHFSVKLIFHAFHNNPLSYATSGQTVMGKMTVH